MLRTVLIVFGWLIPIVTLLLIATDIYASGIYRANSDTAPQLWISVVQAIARGVQSLVLSPLCFFGAYMLDARSRSGE